MQGERQTDRGGLHGRSGADLGLTTSRAPRVLLPGIGLLAILFAAGADGWQAALVRAVFIAGPILFLLSCFWGPRSVTWDRDGLVSIRFGPWCWPRGLKLRPDELRAELAFTPRASCRDFSLLLWCADSETPCLLAAARDRASLLPAFRAIQACTGERAIDHSVEVLTLPDHTELTVSRASIHLPHSAAPRLRQPCDHLLLIGPSWVEAVLGVMVILLGLGLMTCAVLGRNALAGLLGGVFLIGLCWVFWVYPRSRIDRDARTVSVWYAVGCRPARYRFSFSQIAAVQICRQWVEDGEGPGDMHYQINLVLCHADDRVSLWNCTDWVKTQHAATRVAQLIGVPLLDHRSGP